jgi:hypothetical protein
MNVRGAVRLLIAMAIAILASLGTGSADASLLGREGREEGAQSRIHVDPNGMASVDFQLRYRVGRGPLHGLEILGVDDAADVDPRVVVSAEDGREILARADRTAHRGLRLVIEDSRGLAHGVFTFDIRWQADLIRTGALSRGDSGWTLTWSSPRPLDGFDSARTVFEFPSAPDAPRAISAGELERGREAPPSSITTGALDDAPGAVIRRSGAYDEVEIVIPHVSPGQTLVSTLRLDERALPMVAAPPPLSNPRAASQRPNPIQNAIFGALLAVVALSLSLSMAKANRTLSQGCALRGVPPPGGLVPIPHMVRIVFGGLSFAAGVGLQLREEYTAGAAFVALATVLAAVRPPVASAPARGPGRWLPLGPERASSNDDCRITAWPNLRTRAGRAIAGIFGILVVAGVIAARWLDAPDPWIVALDAAPFVPLMVLGRGICAKPAYDRNAVRWIAAAFRRLERARDLHTVLWGRVAGARASADELRVLAIPRAPIPGLVGIELGLAWSATPVGWSCAPEVLVRVRAESPASEALARALPRQRTLPGRRADERVARLVPQIPTRSCALALVREVASRVTERRMARSARPWTAPERRCAVGLWTSDSMPVRASSPGTGVAA